MLKLILWPTKGIKKQQVQLIGTYHNICFYALHGKVDEYDFAYAEIANGVLLPVDWINRCQYAAEQLVPDPLQRVITWFNDSLASNDNMSIGVAEYLNRLPEAIEHNRKIDAIKAQLAQDKANTERQEQEANELMLQAKREGELARVAQEFVNGKLIKSRDFVDLCKDYDVVIPLKTLGWCYKSLKLISPSSCERKQGSNMSTVIFDYADKLLTAIRKHFAYNSR